MGVLTYLFSFLTPGGFLYVDLFAAATNAFNGALLAQRPDHYKRGIFTVVGILVMAIFGGVVGVSPVMFC